MNPFADRLDALGVITGAFLVLVALATAAGTPWTYSGGALVAIVQILGIITTLAIGIGLAWLTHTKA